MVPPGGTREKSSGPSCRSSYLKPKRAPTPHEVFRGAPSPSYVGGQGPIRASCRAIGFHAPGAFSLGPLQRPVLFAREKRMGGWKALLLEGATSAAFGRKDKLGRASRGMLPPVQWYGKSNPPAHLRRAAPFTQGGLILCRLAAGPLGPRPRASGGAGQRQEAASPARSSRASGPHSL